MPLALILASLADDISAFLAEETRPNVLRELPDSVTAEELEADTKSWILEYLTSKYVLIVLIVYGYIFAKVLWLLIFLTMSVALFVLFYFNYLCL